MLKRDRFSPRDYDLARLRTASPALPPKASGSPIQACVGPKTENGLKKRVKKGEQRDCTSGSLSNKEEVGQRVERNSRDRSIDAASVCSKGSRLGELCEEDRAKIGSRCLSGSLIQRLALESEQKQQAEAEVTRVKEECRREMEAMALQNRQLAENSRAIEQKYRDLTELALKSREKQSNVPVLIPGKPPVQGARHKTSQEAANLYTEKSKATRGGKKIRDERFQSEMAVTLLKNKEEYDKNAVLRKERCEDLVETLPRTVAKTDEKLDRFLLPRREGESLERMEKGETVAEIKGRKGEREVDKRVAEKKNTLADILRLKAEIEEVSSTLRVDAVD